MSGPALGAGAGGRRAPRPRATGRGGCGRQAALRGGDNGGGGLES
jgi:hypothetical protein